LDYPDEPEPEIQKSKSPKQIIQRLNHPIRDVKHLLSVLETWEWKISIRQALEDPEAWQDDVILLKGLGERYKRIRSEEQGDE
jgi:hypothetical protein